nr:family 20 glycosylhydrolase [uncultured Bacteroides sp.]
MIFNSRTLVLVVWTCLFARGLQAQDPISVRIVPRPVEAVAVAGTFHITSSTVVSVGDEGLKPLAEYFGSLFVRPAGFSLKVCVGGHGNIRLERVDDLSAEAYRLHVDSNGVLIEAGGYAGGFYALQTLRLALPAAIESFSPVEGVEWMIPAMHVVDSPRFAYRGLMLDVSRYFIPKENVLQIIDCIAMLKLNKLHLHLTDDNGWRLEIKRYPRLTEVGSRRVNRNDVSFPARRNPLPGEPASVGGYYTQDDMREIIAYAQARQVEIIPEIDMPAHSNAALAAYPELACPVVDKHIGVLPGLGGDHADIIYCAGNEQTFHFLEGVIDEVAALFPSKYIHLGGDEAWKTYWKKCPLCQQRMKDENLPDEEELQSYFMRRMSRYVQSKGKEVMGWDELTNGTLPEGAIVFGWQGFGNAALKAAAQGHRFVMTPARLLYLIRYQGPQWFEPLTYFGNNTLKDIYTYEPVQKDWKPEYEPLLMGVQGSMWTEFCNHPSDVTYQVFPRLAAVAEVAWSPKGSKDWPAFVEALDGYLAHLEAKGIRYARSMYNIQHTVMPAGGKLKVELVCERPDVEIRYTTDGMEPGAASERYEGPLTVDADAVLKCATFRDGRKMGKTLELRPGWNLATAKPLLGLPPQAGILVNGLRGSLKQTDFEWYTGDTSRPLAFTVDLLERQEIRECTVGCITNYGMGCHKPRTLTVEVSDDNRTFVPAGSLSFADSEIFREGTFVEDLTLEADVKARYVRFTLDVPGNCPPDHVRPGQPSRIYVDEVIIR